MPIQRTYCDYKDSGVQWLGKVPEHWEILRLKGCALLNPSKKETLRSILADTPVTFLPMECIGTEGTVDMRQSRPASEVWNGFTYFQRSDVLLAKITPCFENGKGALLKSLPSEIGFGSTEFHILRAKASILPSYLYRITTVVEFRRCGADAMTGAAGQQRVPQEFIANYLIALPPHSEQLAIVRFLDHMDRRIRRYIRTKQRLIKLLEEYKQVIIHRAVTRGLDPTVPLKPSGVDWLGEVPEHWEVMPLRRVTITRCDGPFGSGLKSSHYTDQGIRVVRLQNIGYAEFKNHDSAFISPLHYASLGDHTVEPGDLLIAGLGDESRPAGRACVAPSCIVPAMVKADCFRFRLFQQRLDPEFAALQLTATASNSSSFLSTGATRQRMNLQVTASRLIALPPLHEQIEIVKFIIDHTSPLCLAVSGIDKEITLLREYRTRLISDVVTGKLDVRGIELPADEDAEVPTEFSEHLDDDIAPDDCEIPEEISAEAD